MREREKVLPEKQISMENRKWGVRIMEAKKVP